VARRNVNGSSLPDRPPLASVTRSRMASPIASQGSATEQSQDAIHGSSGPPSNPQMAGGAARGHAPGPPAG
jgi:hypothetical protein